MIESADARGVTMRVARELRDYIQARQRQMSYSLGRTVTIIEVTAWVAHVLSSHDADFARITLTQDTSNDS